MARLVDTNILVYRFDPRDPAKQQIAERLLRGDLIADTLILPHQAILEFVAAVTRNRTDLNGLPLLSRNDALIEAEELTTQFPVIYPNNAVLQTAMKGAAVYGLSWFDAHLWAYAEVEGLAEIVSEDFEHGRRYGNVRIFNPFLAAEGGVHDLPAIYT